MDGKARKVKIDEEGRITRHTGSLRPDAKRYCSMEMYLMRKDLLIELVETSLAQGQDHLVRHAIYVQGG